MPCQTASDPGGKYQTWANPAVLPAGASRRIRKMSTSVGKS